MDTPRVTEQRRRLRGHPSLPQFLAVDAVGTAVVVGVWLVLGLGWVAVTLLAIGYLAVMLASTYRLCRDWRDRTGTWEWVP